MFISASIREEIKCKPPNAANAVHTNPAAPCRQMRKVKKRQEYHAAPTSTPTTILLFVPVANLSLHLLHTSSKPSTTSPHIRAHSLPANLSFHRPFSTHLTPSSLASASRRNSSTSSFAALSLLDANEVVCRIMCRLSERPESVESRFVVEERRRSIEERVCGSGAGRGWRVERRGRSSSIEAVSGGRKSGEKRGWERFCRMRVWCVMCEVRAVWVVMILNGPTSVCEASKEDEWGLPCRTLLKSRL